MTDNIDDFMKLFSGPQNVAPQRDASQNTHSSRGGSHNGMAQSALPEALVNGQGQFVDQTPQHQTVQHEAAQYLDRFASNDPEDAQFENEQLTRGASEYLSRMPDAQFQQAAQHAWTQVDDVQRQGLAGALLQALQNRGLEPGVLGSLVGLRSSDPRRMEADDYVRLADFARTRHPDAMRDIVQQQPWLLKALGNPVVLSVLSVIALRMLQNRR